MVMCLVCTQIACAQMQELGDDQLSLVSARSGITLSVRDSAMRYTNESIWIGDTDHDPAHLIKFNEVSVDDGAGGYFSFSTPGLDPITIDVGTDGFGKTVVALFLTDHTYPRTISVGNIDFCDQDIGGLSIEEMTITDNQVYIGAHGGIDLEDSMRLDIENIRYAYNTSEELTFSGITLAGSFAGSPEDPTAWVSSGKFQLGDMTGDNPVTCDVGTNAAGKTALLINMPMQGSLRVEGVSFGGSDFGPCAIDGIRVHHLNMLISPGP